MGILKSIEIEQHEILDDLGWSEWKGGRDGGEGEEGCCSNRGKYWLQQRENGRSNRGRIVLLAKNSECPERYSDAENI